MQKSFIALAVLAVTSSVSAQSSVTLFGVVDVAVSRYSVKSEWYNNTANPFLLPPPGQPDSIKRSQTALSQGNLATSRLGFRATEDLGGGLAASFWLEGQINPDDGSRGILNFNRRSTISLLSSTLGELRLGRDYTPSFWNDTVFDPLAGLGTGISLINTIFQNLATVRGAATTANPGVIGLGSHDSYVRTSNSVGYFLPPTLGGVYGQVQYALHENVEQSNLPGTPSKKGRSFGGRLGYANGPIDVAVAYGESTVGDVTALTAAGLPTGAGFENKIKNANLGASYDFGVIKLFGEVSMARDELETSVPLTAGLSATVSEKDKYTGGLIGATVPVGPGLIRLAYQRVKFKNDPGLVPPTLFAPNRDASANKLAISYVHNLSKRTALYATAARIRVKNGENNPAVMGATAGGSPTYLSTGNGVAGYRPRSATGFDFGIRHAF
ncbi:porin [Variovorax sp. WS11]|uniref:porin n=1 Tax=Variovorax sp. WS11 TaxID=1105204 RepID=UPI000D0CC2A3|nr:porin [Variovorax sp. WS11]NDZ18851.1 porin [Variovorax sp. WS11]PSL79372.1 porin [Variovorax sp. WS11]